MSDTTLAIPVTVDMASDTKPAAKSKRFWVAAAPLAAQVIAWSAGQQFPPKVQPWITAISAVANVVLLLTSKGDVTVTGK